jgi:hypothetical protein
MNKVNREDIHLWEVTMKYMSLVDIEAVREVYTDMCDMMKQDKSN